MAAKKPKKKQSIRNNEYYNTQKCFDQLYQDSLHGKRFTQLMDIITSEENIMLAYRSIKKNKGSKTKGTNNSTIVQMGEKARMNWFPMFGKDCKISILMRSVG